MTQKDTEAGVVGKEQPAAGSGSPPAFHDADKKMSADDDAKLDDELRDLPPDPDEGLSPEERAKNDKLLVRKLDWALIPWLSLLYLMSFLDRTNIGNAKLAGIQQDLGLSADGSQYNAALSIFFVSYAGFEPFTNIMIKRFRPSIFLPIIMILWGICMTTMGLTHNFSGLMAARFFLGVAEAGLFPGVNYYLSCWYRREEFGIRGAIFFSAAALSGSFGGLLAYAIEKMNGIGGKAGWAWIFILEGLLTVVVGAVSFYMVKDFPDTATWLAPDEQARAIRRLADDRQSSAHHEDWQWKYFWAAATDVKTYLACLVYMGTDMPLYAFSLFLPTIIAGLGTYSTVQSQLLTIPPYAAATVATIFVGWLADRTQRRGYCNIVSATIGVIGFAMLTGASSPNVRYAGTFLGACGIYPCIANTISWASHNIEPSYKRGVAIGIYIGWGNLQGIVSSNIYITRDGPSYRIGHGIVLAYLTLFLLGGSILQHFYLLRENRAKLAGKRDYLVEGKSKKELADLGDYRPDFLYVT